MQIKGRIGYTTTCLLVVLACGFVMNGCSPQDDTSVAQTEGTQFTIKNKSSVRQDEMLVRQMRKGTQFTIKNKGSDTMVNLAQAWAEKYTDVSTTTSVEVSGGGSGTGVAALINGTVDMGTAVAKLNRKNWNLRRKTPVKPLRNLSSVTMPSQSMSIGIHPSIKLRSPNLQKFMVRTAQ